MILIHFTPTNTVISIMLEIDREPYYGVRPAGDEPLYRKDCMRNKPGKWQQDKSAAYISKVNLEQVRWLAANSEALSVQELTEKVKLMWRNWGFPTLLGYMPFSSNSDSIVYHPS